MKNKIKVNSRLLTAVMALIGVVFSLLTVVLRVWVLPSLRDWDTGLYSANHILIALLLVMLAVLAVLGCLAAGKRRELEGYPARVTAVLTALCGVAMAVTEVLAVSGSWQALQAASVTEQPKFVPLLAVLQNGCGLLGGAALVVMGLRLLTEGVTRRGMAQWSALAPVLWMWLRLVNYEVSYASMVRLKDSFFGLGMLILELLFLFKMARYAAGVGKLPTGRMVAYSMATAVLALSAPLTRWILFLQGDAEAYAAHHLARPVDFAIGVMALAFGLSLALAVLKAQPEELEEPVEESAEEPAAPESAESKGLVSADATEQPEA